MSKKLIINPNIVLRTELDDWGILFDPDTGETRGVSPTGIFIWERLDGTRTKEQILAEMAEAYDGGIPENGPEEYDEFVSSLQEKGYVSV
jgi:SynChlorMet cassette protein ScmD